MERCILVAEDSPTQAEHIRLLLEAEGYRVEVVANGREGLERVQSAPPDLVISDVVMPEMDGYAFCRAVKSAERTRRIPFVLLTERNTPADFIKGLQDGADNFITKPFEDDYLRERVRRIFENLELRRQGRLDVEITLHAGGRQLAINTDKQQMIELLFATLEDLVRTNGRLAESQRIVEEYAHNLEAKVRERTEQLLKTEKLATMGELLAGVAHELNNPLTVVIGQAHLLRLVVKDSSLVQRAEKIHTAADRCVRVVRNFLALARQHTPERGEVRLNDVVQEAVELLAYELRTGDVEVVLNRAEDLPILWADAHQLHQVLVNLIVNAEHALRHMPSARRITLTTRFDRDHGRVHLEVGDTGPGILPEIQARIFEPFFTTKPSGQGTGLGLSLCQGIIEEHGGMIRVESEPGRGATFLIELPVVTRPAAVMTSAPAEPLPAMTSKTILVVDDELEIAAMLAEMLQRAGHRVDVAANGQMALEMLERGGYDLILTDTKMPVLDGVEFYRALERRFPQFCHRLIFITGDVLDQDKRSFLAATGAPCLAKPLDLDEVLRVVQRILASPASSVGLPRPSS